MDSGNDVVENAPVKKQDGLVKRAWKKVVNKIKEYNFEKRYEKNALLPQTKDQAIDQGFVRDPLDSFHQDKTIIGRELKYIHPDGREIVFYEKGAVVTDPKIRGTYNYSPNDIGANPIRSFTYPVRAIGHVLLDILPHKVFGGSGYVR